MKNRKKVLSILLPLALMIVGCSKDNKNDVGGRNYSTYTWMTEISDDKMLSELSIPGTHDSGTKEIGPGPAHTQNFSIEQQLNDGIRFLDIRLKKKDGKLKLYHGHDVFSYDCKVYFNTVLDWCKDFLKKYPNEVILMSIKNEEPDEDITGYLNDLYFGDDEHSTSWEDLFWRGNSNDPKGNCKDRLPTLGEVRGKIVVFKRFEYVEKIDHFIDWYTEWDGANKKSETFQIKNQTGFWYYIEDKFNEHDTNKKLDEVEKHLNAAHKGNAKDVYLTFNSIAYNTANGRTPYWYAWGSAKPKMNKGLEDFLYDNQGKHRWGIVVLDFYNDEGENNNIVQYIINSNF